MTTQDDTSTEDTNKVEIEVLDKSKSEDLDKSKETDTSTKKTEDDKSTDESETDKNTEKETETDKSSDEDKTKAGDDSTAKTEQNRLGFQLRQIRANDPYVATVRKSLQDDYVNEAGLSDVERELRQIKSDNYLKELETKRAKIVADNLTIAQEIPMFNPSSKQFNKELYERSLARFDRDSIEKDDNGEIIGFKVPLLDYMREEADSYRALVEKGGKKTESTKEDKSKDKESENAKMDAAGEDVGSTSGADTKSASEKDKITSDFLKGFDSVK